MGKYYKPKNLRRKKLERAEAILLEVARKYMLSVQTIRGGERYRHIIEARREFCRRAHAEGIGCVLIGKALWRHHDTVQYYLNPNLLARRQARYATRQRTEKTDGSYTPASRTEPLAARAGHLSRAGAAAPAVD